MENQKTIVIELRCICGAICGTLTLPADHPKANAPLIEHGIEKVVCDECLKKQTS